MNCKPGNIAVITHPTMAGHLVSVLYAAPVGRQYHLPDGQLALTEHRCDNWVCESLGALFPVRVKTASGIKPRLARYASIQDHWLRPIRGDGIGDDEVAELYRPAPAQPVKTGEPA